MPNFALSWGFTPFGQHPVSAEALIEKTQPKTRMMGHVPIRWTPVLPWM
jgi:hypothetical protein